MSLDENPPSNVTIKGSLFSVTREAQTNSCLIILMGADSTHYFTVQQKQEQMPEKYIMTRDEFKKAYDNAASFDIKKELVIRLAQQLYGKN